MKKQTGLETTPLTCEALLKTTEGVAGDDRADHVSESLAPENNEYACTPDSAGNAVTLTGTMLSIVTCHLASIYWQLEAQAPAGSTKEAGTLSWKLPQTARTFRGSATPVVATCSWRNLVLYSCSCLAALLGDFAAFLCRV